MQKKKKSDSGTLLRRKLILNWKFILMGYLFLEFWSQILEHIVPK